MHCNDNPTVSPGGRIIAYDDSWDCFHGIGIVIAAVTTTGRPAELPFRFPDRLAGSVFEPAWAPNGRLLAYVFMDMEAAGGSGEADASGLYVSSSNKTRPRRISQWMGAPAWSKDGNWVASSGDGILIMRADGTHVRTLTHQESDTDPAWLPPAIR
jgi:Tol biopolymer transport system component